MKIITIITIFTAFILCGCEKKVETQAKMKYLFEDIRFYDDGTVRDPEYNITGEYREYSSSLQILEGEHYPMFEKNGQIISGWKMLNYFPVYSPLQITNFKVVNSNHKRRDIFRVTDTALIIFAPEQQSFEDEYSSEAAEFQTSIDDWMWYMSETQTEIEKLGVKRNSTNMRYFSFMVNSRENIIVDRTEYQNEQPVSALLYKTGVVPIIVFPNWADNNLEIISRYLEVDIPILATPTIKQTSTFAGIYRYAYCCELLLEIFHHNDEYTYHYHFKDEIYRGKITVKNDKKITLNSIIWFKDIGELSEDEDPTELESVFHTVGIDLTVEESGSLKFKNIGCQKNYFQVIDCENLYIFLEKEA